MCRKGEPQVIGGRKTYRSIADVELAVVTYFRNGKIDVWTAEV